MLTASGHLRRREFHLANGNQSYVLSWSGNFEVRMTGSTWNTPFTSPITVNYNTYFTSGIFDGYREWLSDSFVVNGQTCYVQLISKTTAASRNVRFVVSSFVRVGYKQDSGDSIVGTYPTIISGTEYGIRNNTLSNLAAAEPV
jgi:hypothetical protein